MTKDSDVLIVLNKIIKNNSIENNGKTHYGPIARTCNILIEFKTKFNISFQKSFKNKAFLKDHIEAIKRELRQNFKS